MVLFPDSVHVSQHPCLQAKLSQLRSKNTNARETKALVHEIAIIVGCEALAKGLEAVPSGTVSVLCGISIYVLTAGHHPGISLLPNLKGKYGADAHSFSRMSPR